MSLPYERGPPRVHRLDNGMVTRPTYPGLTAYARDKPTTRRRPWRGYLRTYIQPYTLVREKDKFLVFFLFFFWINHRGRRNDREFNNFMMMMIIILEEKKILFLFNFVYFLETSSCCNVIRDEERERERGMTMTRVPRG